MYNSWRLSGNASDKVYRKMRVALDARYIRTTETEVFPSGGVGRYTYHLVKQLVKLDPELELTLIVPSGNQRPIVEGSNASRVREVRFNAPAHSMRTQFRLTRGIDLEGVDLFHSPFNVLPRGIPCRSIATIHDVMWLSRPEYCTSSLLLQLAAGTFYRFGINHALRQATLILTVSHASRKAIAAYNPEAGQRTHVTHNGLDPYFKPISRKEAERVTAELIPPGNRFILSVGQGSPYKNHIRATEAFLQAFSERSELRCVVVRRFSRWGDLEMKRLLKRLDRRNQVIILPKVTDAQLRGLYNRAGVFLHPSLDEGFGIPVLEAMACGAPVVTSNVSSLPEVAGDAALYVNPFSTAEIADALIKLNEDESLRTELAHRGRLRSQTFTWEECARQTLEVYRKAMRRSLEAEGKIALPTKTPEFTPGLGTVMSGTEKE